MHLIFERLKGATFQTELLVMTLLGLANSTLNWSPFDWTIQAEKINTAPMTSKYSEGIKTVLRWVVIARIIIDHMYFASYLGNLYSVFTWCRPNLLLPWMIVSALKNFLLEFIPFAIAWLLYLEGNFPSILFFEFIVESAITFVIAAYYWCGIKKLFVELSRIQYRKLTRANLIANSDTNAATFETNFPKNVNNKRKNFISLTNFDELSLNWSFEFDGDREQCRLTKSLTTLMSMDSQIQVEPEEDIALPITESILLTPAEKAMQILSLNQDDIKEARIRLGKNILINTSGVEEMEDQSTKVHKGQSSVNSQKVIEMSSNQNSLKDPIINRNTSQGVFKETGNLKKLCTCMKSNDASVNVDVHENIKNSLTQFPGEESNEYEEDDDDSSGNRNLSQTGMLLATPSKQNVNTELKNFGPSIFWSIDFPRSHLYKEDAILSDWCYDEDIKNSETKTFPSLQVNHSFQSLVTPSFGKEEVECLYSTSDNLKNVSIEPFKANEISLEQRKQREDNTDVSGNEITHETFEEIPQQYSLFKIKDTSFVKSKQVEENSEIVTSVRNYLDIDVQTDFDDDVEQLTIDQDIAEAQFFPNNSRASTSTQTNISDFWKKAITNLKKPLKIDIDQHLSETKCQDFQTHRRKFLLSGITRFVKISKRPEKIEEREAREMRALRTYNRLTLLEDKREMEMKKRNSAFPNRTGLQNMICSINLMKTATRNMREVSKVEPKQGLENEKLQAKLDQVPKRLARSRPQEKTSKLSTFNLGLDSLENSISSSFSSENKNRSKLHHLKNNTNQISSDSQKDGRKQLSKYSKPMRFFDETSDSSPSITRIEGLQTGRDLDRTRGVENMTNGKTIRKIDRNIEHFNQNRLQEVLSGTILSSPESLRTQQSNPLEINEFKNRVAVQDKHEFFGLKETIKNMDWRFNDHTLYRDDVMQRENAATSQENVFYDIIDDTDTISLLQSAFASNPGNTERGFYLGPGSTELYSVSNFLEDVVEEIMKTARLRPNPDAFTAKSTTEVDYGESYLQGFEVTTLLTAENSDEETLTNSNSDTEKSVENKIEEVESMINEHLTPSKPVEMCWSSYSREGIDTRDNQQLSTVVTDLVNERTEEDHFYSESYRDRLGLKNLDDNKNIAELLGEQEISYVEYWAKELKDLALNDRRNDFEFTKEFQHLTKLPGFCVVKLLVDFFRHFVAVSRSTMTSRMFLGTNPASTPSSVGSEEFISGHFNELSNTSATIEPPNIANHFESFEIIENDLSVSLQTLIDRLTESPDTSNHSSDPVFGVHDDRSIFPLREDQFYFGTPENTRLIKELLTLSPEPRQDGEANRNLHKKLTDGNENDRECMSEEIDEYQITKQPSPEAHVPITFYIIGATSIIHHSSQAHGQGTVLPKNAEAPFRIDSTENSFDSLYLAGVAGNSKSSDNVISIGAASSFEEFPEDT